MGEEATGTQPTRQLFVPKERAEGETRIAVTPETVKRLSGSGFSVSVESGAGAAASFTDDALKSAGATITSDVDAALSSADVVLSVQPLPAERCSKMKAGAWYLSFLAPFGDIAPLVALRDAKVSAFAMELVPRISRAQSMDALSSQASIGGYKAVVMAAERLDKYFPLLMTAAGTIQPARVVIMGAGVAGLQAIATARRLGAVVEVSDIRPAVKEQVESLGGKFIDVPMEESGEGEGGYAKEVTPEFLKKQQAIVRERVTGADVVITTALVPGRPAPKLVTAETVEAMRPGSVIIDLAVAQGGNCELTEPGEHIKHGVRIVGEFVRRKEGKKTA